MSVVNHRHLFTFINNAYFYYSRRLNRRWQAGFTCSLNVCVGFLWVLRIPPTSEKHASRWIYYTKLPLVVNV